MWSKREEEPEFSIPPPDRDGVTRVLEYTMDDPDAEVPKGVTISGEGRVSFRDQGLLVREPGEQWTTLKS